MSKQVIVEPLPGALWFTARWSFDEYWTDVEVFEYVFKDGVVPMYERKDSGGPMVNPTSQLDEAEVYLQGYVKWDGCTELNQGLPHWCGVDGYRNHVEILKYVYQRSFVLMGREHEPWVEKNECLDGQISDLLQGFGASEDHKDVIEALISLGLSGKVEMYPQQYREALDRSYERGARATIAAAPAAVAPSSAAEPSDNFEMPNTFKLPGESDEAWVDRITGASQSAPPQGAAAEVEKAIDAYIEEYEMYCEDEGGREGFYSPSERERDLIKDAIMGLLADDDFCAAFTPQRNAAQEIAHQLRAACLSVRSKSYPLADLIPLMQQAADELSTSTGATP